MTFLLPILSAIAVATNSVTFSVTATGVDTATPVEFLFAGPASDRDYESLFLLEDKVDDLVAAFARAGIPTGTPIDVKKSILWPVGTVVTFKPDLKEFLSDATKSPLLPAVYTGGNGDRVMPQAVFATYCLGQSLFQFDDAFDQSQVYGRFHAARQLEKGKKYTFTAFWDGTNVTKAVTPDFPADKTVAEAVKVATGLRKLDSRQFKVNGHREGQFFYQAFLPLEKWRDRSERLVQPLEIRVSATNVAYTVVEEDWKVEGTDPKLLPKSVSADEAKRFKGDSALIFTSGDMRLGRLYELRRELPAKIRNWYVFVD